jgi:hypothetical protein
VKRAAFVGLALPLLAACGGDERVDLTVDIRFSEEAETFELSCHPTGGTVSDPEAACAELDEHGDIYFPAEREECPLPYPSMYLLVEGTYRGKSLDQAMTPCSDEEERAVDAWASLVGFEPLPFERR